MQIAHQSISRPWQIVPIYNPMPPRSQGCCTCLIDNLVVIESSPSWAHHLAWKGAVPVPLECFHRWTTWSTFVPASNGEVGCISGCQVILKGHYVWNCTYYFRREYFCLHSIFADNVLEYSFMCWQCLVKLLSNLNKASVVLHWWCHTDWPDDLYCIDIQKWSLAWILCYSPWLHSYAAFSHCDIHRSVLFW